MKAIIRDETSKLNGTEHKVRRINFDNVAVEKGLKSPLEEFDIEKVELIGENKVEDILIDNKDLLKIRILRGVPQKFYELLSNSIEEFIGEKLIHINILMDENRTISKRNMWEKECYLMINDKFPIHLSVNGKKFKNKDFYFNIEEIPEEKFLELSNNEINRIRKKMKTYGDSLREVKAVKYNILKSSKINL